MSRDVVTTYAKAVAEADELRREVAHLAGLLKKAHALLHIERPSFEGSALDLLCKAAITSHFADASNMVDPHAITTEPCHG